MAKSFGHLKNSTTLSGALGGNGPKTRARAHGSFEDDTELAVRYVSTRLAAHVLGLKPQTLAKWRWSGRGPPYTKLNGAVRYALADAGQRLSTSADPLGPVGGK